MHRIWVSGYRAYELEIFNDNDPKVTVIKSVIKEQLQARLNQSTDTFWLITGPQSGIERWTLQVGLKLQSDYAQLKIGLMSPYLNVEKRWKPENQAQLSQLRSLVDYSASVSNHDYQSASQLRDYQRFMLNHTDEMLLIYDPEMENNPDRKSKPFWDYRAAKRYAEDQDYPIMVIDFDQLQEAAEEIAENHPEMLKRSNKS